MARTVRATILATIWAAATGLAAAQTGNLKDTQLTPDRVASGRAIVIGCLSRERAGQFLITDTRARPPAQYRLEGNADLLRFHVGHTVEIAGSAKRGAGAGAGTLNVEALTYLSTTCAQLQ